MNTCAGIDHASCLFFDIDRTGRTGKRTQRKLSLFQVCANGVKAALDENAFLVRGRGARPSEQVVQFIEIGLRHVARADGVRVLDCDGDDAALFVIGDGCKMGESLGRGESISFAIELLQVESINQVAADRSALQQVLIERGGRVPAQ